MYNTVMYVANKRALIDIARLVSSTIICLIRSNRLFLIFVFCLFFQNIPTAEVKQTLDKILILTIERINSESLNIEYLISTHAPQSHHSVSASTAISDPKHSNLSIFKVTDNNQPVKGLMTNGSNISIQGCEGQASAVSPSVQSNDELSDFTKSDSDEEVMWYFTPTDSHTIQSSVDELTPCPISLSTNLFAPNSKASKSITKPAAIVHSDDDDFADCFDDVEPASTNSSCVELNSNANTNSIDWLNKALNSLTTKSPAKKVNILSRHGPVLGESELESVSDDHKQSRNTQSHTDYYDETRNISSQDRLDNHRLICSADLTENPSTNKFICCASQYQSPDINHSDSSTRPGLDKYKTPPRYIPSTDVPERLDGTDSSHTKNPAQPLTLSDIVSGVCRHDDLISKLLSQVVNKLTISTNSTSGNSVRSELLSNVTVLSCVGPLSCKSCVVHGIVLQCSEEAVQLIGTGSRYLRTVVSRH